MLFTGDIVSVDDEATTTSDPVTFGANGTHQH